MRASEKGPHRRKGTAPPTHDRACPTEHAGARHLAGRASDVSLFSAPISIWRGGWERACGANSCNATIVLTGYSRRRCHDGPSTGSGEPSQRNGPDGVMVVGLPACPRSLGRPRAAAVPACSCSAATQMLPLPTASLRFPHEPSDGADICQSPQAGEGECWQAEGSER